MCHIGVLAIRALAGGALVVLFSVVGELLRPKSFAGIFAAAPSVALASLLVTSVSAGETGIRTSAVGMIAGAIALVAACVIGIDAVKRFRARRGSLASILVWLLVAGGIYGVVLR